MTAGRPKIYFLGSGHLAIPILERIAKSDKLEIAGCGTQQDHPAGRGKIPSPTPACRHMEMLGLKPDKPGSVNSPEFIAKMRGIAPDMIFVASFGQILREEILSLPPFGCMNAHASLLPAYRGASPVQAALLNGDRRSGMTFMMMEKGLDTGPIVRQYGLEVEGRWKAPDLESRLGALAAEHVEEAIIGLTEGTIVPSPQPATGISIAKKIRKEDGRIDWGQDAAAVNNKVRAYFPWPCASFELDIDGRSIHIKITESEASDASRGIPGTIVAGNGCFAVNCGKGMLVLDRIIPEGRREMGGTEFLRGLHGKNLSIREQDGRA